MRIGELAAATGVTAKTIRFWEHAGVLDLPSRTASGYREYPPETARRVEFVRAAQEAGFTLAEIATVVAIRRDGEAPCGHVRELVHQHLAEIETRLRDLRRLRGELRRLAERAEHTVPAACPPGSICRIITDP